jgi:hypothetical protein
MFQTSEVSIKLIALFALLCVLRPPVPNGTVRAGVLFFWHRKERQGDAKDAKDSNRPFCVLVLDIPVEMNPPQ